jgi:hypothetical protein
LASTVKKKKSVARKHKSQGERDGSNDEGRQHFENRDDGRNENRDARQHDGVLEVLDAVLAHTRVNEGRIRDDRQDERLPDEPGTRDLQSRNGCREVER